jgi:NAD(P)-dependent dehydrogenase (short-subunit alcohol dehydrogenase family)
MKSVLITGTSRGIGFETSLAFARAGYTVHATMRNPSQSPALAQAVAELKVPLYVTAMDVDSDESVSATIKAIQANYGPVDVLVNNAGVAIEGTVEELPLAQWKTAIETNYLGALRCIQAVVGQMRKRHSGCIINISSVAGRIAASPLTPYMASKWALEALSEGLAGEMKSFGVHVAIVEPGIIDTKMARQCGERPSSSLYAQPARFAGIFSESLKAPVPPSVVAAKILEIAQSGTWQLRHPVGPSAIPFLEWRKAMTDETWVDLNATDDERWYTRIQQDFGLNTRPDQPAAAESGQLATSV